MDKDQTYCEWVRQFGDFEYTDQEILKNSQDHWEETEIIKLKGDL